MKMSLNEVIEQFNKVITDAEIFISPARSTKLQRQQCEILEKLLENASSFKQQAIANSDEDSANLFLGFECVIGSLVCELRMWILLKQERPNQAWDQLISAQIGVVDAGRAHRGFSHVPEKLQRLEQIEKTIFPPQSFLSAGFVAKRLDCSICGSIYGVCDHLQYKPYMGQFCYVIPHKIEADHVALVDTPADKRCRVISIKTEQGNRDKMSWDITPYKLDEKFSSDVALEINGSIFVIGRQPYLDSNEKIFAIKQTEGN